MWTSLCMLGLHCTAVSSHPIWVAFGFLRLMWLVLLCVCVVCAAFREQLYSYFFFHCSFSLVLAHVLLTPWKEMCSPQENLNNVHNGVWCVPICGPGVMLLHLAPLFTNITLLSAFIPFFLPLSQARRELKRLKEEARRKHAVAVIWAYWLGLKVSSNHFPGVWVFWKWVGSIHITSLSVA